MFFSDKGSNYRKLLFKVTSALDAKPPPNNSPNTTSKQTYQT